jgi:hypothetical protein
VLNRIDVYTQRIIDEALDPTASTCTVSAVQMLDAIYWLDRRVKSLEAELAR